MNKNKDILGKAISVSIGLTVGMLMGHFIASIRDSYRMRYGIGGGASDHENLGALGDMAEELEEEEEDDEIYESVGRAVHGRWLRDTILSGACSIFEYSRYMSDLFSEARDNEELVLRYCGANDIKSGHLKVTELARATIDGIIPTRVRIYCVATREGVVRGVDGSTKYFSVEIAESRENGYITGFTAIVREKGARSIKCSSISLQSLEDAVIKAEREIEKLVRNQMKY